jgi:hypothetical protein
MLFLLLSGHLVPADERHEAEDATAQLLPPNLAPFRHAPVSGDQRQGVSLGLIWNLVLRGRLASAQPSEST